jgi:DNA-binding transcriptional ArsR family regulator
MKMANEQLDRTLNALADPTRRAILRRLMRGPARVTEVAKPFRMSLNAVSKHVRVLEEARLLRRRREGREHWLSYQGAPVEEVAEWREEQRQLWAGRLDAMAAALDAEDREKGRKS